MTTQATEENKKKGKGKEIRNPRRLLILSPASHTTTLIPSLLHALTGHAITNPPVQSFAGYTTHPPLRIENKYYSAEVPLWVDEIPIFTATSAPASASTGKLDSTEPKNADETSSGKEGGEEDPASQWAREFSSSEARVVRDAIGAVMICIQNPRSSSNARFLAEGSAQSEKINAEEDRDDVRALKSFISAVGSVRALIEEERAAIGDVPGLLVLGVKKKEQQQKEKRKGGRSGADRNLDADTEFDEVDGLDDPFSIGWWEDRLCEMGLLGFEVVEWDGSLPEKEEERNQYGELQGIRRVKEVLETHEWTGDEEADAGAALPDDEDDLEHELLGLHDEEGNGFNLEVNELEREMVGLRFAIERGGGDGEDEDDEGDEEIRVDAVEALLMRMRAIKDMSDELPAQDRKRFAAKAVRDIIMEI